MEHVIEMGGPGEEEALAAPLRKRVRTLDATVVEVVRETPDVVTLVLSTGRREAYAAGHFLTIDPHQFSCLSDLVAYFEDAKGRREPPRAYSIASSPLEPLLAVTVKEEHYLRGVTRYPPILSPYLVHRVQRGDRLKVVGFTGAYVLPPDLEAKADHLVHLVAGSGSVPNYSILKYALAKHPLLRHTFVYSSKTWSDVIFREGLAEIEKRHPDRVRVVHTLTRQGGPACGEGGVRTGRVTPELLREVIADPAACMVYACGPAVGPFERTMARERGEEPRPRFLEAAKAALAEIGVPKEHIKTEAYG